MVRQRSVVLSVLCLNLVSSPDPTLEEGKGSGDALLVLASSAFLFSCKLIRLQLKDFHDCDIASGHIAMMYRVRLMS